MCMHNRIKILSYVGAGFALAYVLDILLTTL